MTVAETFAEFLLDVRCDDWPDRAVDHAAMLGVEAVLAARKGYTCELKTLEGPRGFSNCTATPMAWVSRMDCPAEKALIGTSSQTWR